jgi:hypothetical protein
MNGEAKRDYPGTLTYQAPWSKEYPFVEDHFARLAAVLTRGKAVCKVGLIHPIESYWLHWGPRESTEGVRRAMDENFFHLCDWLLRGFIDFDYICESTLPDLCDPSYISISGREDQNSKDPKEPEFPVGKMNYNAIIVPAMETIRASTMDRLETFRHKGGKLIFMGPPPAYVDAIASDRGQRLWEQSEHIGFDRIDILKALEAYRDVRIRDDSGALSQGFLYQMREEADEESEVREASIKEPKVRWLFVCHADREQDFDNPRGINYRIQIRGEYRVSEYNTMDGTIGSLEAEISGGWTNINVLLWDHNSLLLRLEPLAQKSGTKEPAGIRVTSIGEAPISCSRITAPVSVTLDEPNVLVLDLADFALDNGAWRGKEEVLRLDNCLRQELGWPSRRKAVAQPWVERDASTPHSLSLAFTFESEIEIKGTELALENAAATKVRLNGQAAVPVQGWYVDKCIGKVKLPSIKAGTNVLELRFPYGKKVDVEACYLLGDFSVNVRGTICTLGKPVKSLTFGDIGSQGLPFYGGNLTYHLEAECKPSPGSQTGSLTIEASSYRFMVLKVAVDGKDKGYIAYAPYRLAIDGLSPGMHKIDLTGFGCRVNTFGQLHNNVARDGYWWGPNSWRTTGPAWSYEYRFWSQGILKSPEIY